MMNSLGFQAINSGSSSGCASRRRLAHRPRTPPLNGTAADMIRWVAGQSAAVLALDAPSGVDATSGFVCDPAIRATATMTLALPKEGLQVPIARAHVGELYLADISVPPELYAEPALGLVVSALFAQSDIVQLV